MSIYAISDIHLSFGTSKPMEIFGDKWQEYEGKIKRDWESKVKDEDTVIIAGDFSWATYIEDAKEDFSYIESLPGKKIIIKGNHDYWWETLSKMNEFLKVNNYKNINFIHNNCIEVEDYVICGTKYWTYTEGEENEKMYNRERQRLESALKQGEETKKPIILVTHYPPDKEAMEIANKYNVKKWIFGHIHSNYEEQLKRIPENKEIEILLTSCDYMDFKLKKIC